MESKQEFRSKGKEILKRLSPDQRGNIIEQIHFHVFESDWWKHASTIGITISNEIELDTKPIIQQAWRENKTVTVPKCFPKEDNKMVFYKFSDYSILETVYSGLQEPDIRKTVAVEQCDIDLMFVPGLMFDKRGYRIGYGGGYYDRYLRGFQGITVSIATSHQIVERVPHDDYDIPVNHIISESGAVF
ncbi:MAG: 5-formyltetrahydrofolate cyclo-ligase [Bacillaceae bacterium]|nr:5-formyltetrahydrofolate cyclo-ligase [Bacillaceae bacterium]